MATIIDRDRTLEGRSPQNVQPRLRPRLAALCLDEGKEA